MRRCRVGGGDLGRGQAAREELRRGASEVQQTPDKVNVQPYNANDGRCCSLPGR